MRIRIVCYEDVNAWILGKFALKLQENLIKLGITADIAKKPDPTADINHHIIYIDYNGAQSSIDTLMITHIDNLEKLEMLKKHFQTASLGICMSAETMNWLTEMGIDRKKICYINPAHDQLVKIKKYSIGITCRVQNDGRKRESFIDKLANDLDPNYFLFKIMGDSWDRQVENLRKKGFEVEYINHFARDKYYQLINSLDYYLYMGMDEGQMGFIDAAAAGINTIVTTQGYHLDAENAITHPFTNYDELLSIFLRIQRSRSQLVNSVSTWNWLDYTKKHIELWEHLLGKKNIKSHYKDGFNSLYNSTSQEIKLDKVFIKETNQKLAKAERKQRYYIIKNTVINSVKEKGLTWLLLTIFKKMIRIKNKKD